ncbi:EpsD family peptidyl-prolyl cis-trans isomerase [Janthinobacterium sp. 17J80-10]|uniref:EpsD family peptidyl-prolyl cis-trans isomerase n=1 Tax=Janthinobacterium sp. 17J80-10 TaxID=2497863 RepID=UPI00100562C3|nr:EpsD family peptidyl-prolyl cis-trans isomerase [Janthinobacterium sp. 17J80-10]QAU34437.1 peptidyl-prolyl cis-trans isomerase, EpsD family [Janthinobacterium sp. 17J80-10]
MRFGHFLKTRTCFDYVGHQFLMLAMVGLPFFLVSCGKQDVPGVPVAQVNGKAITDYHLDRELAQSEAGHANADRSGALQTLINRQLLQDEAQRQSLDRDPHVLSAIENAKAKILAQAYLDSQLAYVAAPTREELQAYFDRHPEKFSKRKLFHLKEIVLPSAELTGELKSAMDLAHSIEDIAAWLDGRRIVYKLGRHTRSSADMPAALLAKIQELQPGQMMAVREGGDAYLIAVASIQESPLSLEAATPQIDRVLLDEKGRERGDAQLARLRAGAKVAYQPGKNSESLAITHVDAMQAAAGARVAPPETRQGAAQ